MDIRFSQSSLKDLEAIKKYIFVNNKQSEKEVVAYIIGQIETILAKNPAIGRAGRVLRTREFIIDKYPYIVPYQVNDNVLYILRVLHTSKKWDI